MSAVEIPFYAPLKSPEHPRPSGDRAMARALIKALEMRDGASVFVASHLQELAVLGDLSQLLQSAGPNWACGKRRA